jgi:hypothetical protein
LINVSAGLPIPVAAGLLIPAVILLAQLIVLPGVDAVGV